MLLVRGSFTSKRASTKMVLCLQQSPERSLDCHELKWIVQGCVRFSSLRGTICRFKMFYESFRRPLVFATCIAGVKSNFTKPLSLSCIIRISIFADWQVAKRVARRRARCCEGSAAWELLIYGHSDLWRAFAENVCFSRGTHLGPRIPLKAHLQLTWSPALCFYGT